MGEAGRRIGEVVARRSSDVPTIVVSSMRSAVSEARRSLSEGGVVLFSPGAPSFDAYKNWEARSDDFTTIVHELTDQ
jgi:UDP-N-acetylmuramoylalanine--D-glutamate ligase